MHTAIAALNREHERLKAAAERRRLAEEQRRRDELRCAWMSSATHQRQRQQVRVLLRQRRRLHSTCNSRRTDRILTLPQSQNTVSQPPAADGQLIVSK